MDAARDRNTAENAETLSERDREDLARFRAALAALGVEQRREVISLIFHSGTPETP